MTSKVFTQGTVIDSGWLNDVNNVVYNYSRQISQTEVHIATSGQTVFTLANAYTPGNNNLAVFIDGLNQILGMSYTETDTTTVTFLTPLHLGALVKFVVNGWVTG